MAVVHLPRSLASLFPAAPRRLEIPAPDLASLIRALDVRFPGMWDRLCEPGPRFRPHINVFVDGQRAALGDALGQGSVVHIIPAVSGGVTPGAGDAGEPEHVHPETREQWAAWLAANHEREHGVWLVAWKSRTGRPRMSYEEVIEEALAWGWVDSRAGRLDDEREMIWMSPRRRGSAWSRSNKERIARLDTEGRLSARARAQIEQAKADGSWTRLDAVEDLIVPEDLARAFDAWPGSRERWESFPPSARRAILAWIVSARRPETRARRLAETAELAQRGERANERRRPSGADRGPS